METESKGAGQDLEKEVEEHYVVKQSRPSTFPSLAMPSGTKAWPWSGKWAGEKHWPGEECQWHNQILNRVALMWKRVCFVLGKARKLWI